MGDYKPTREGGEGLDRKAPQVDQPTELLVESLKLGGDAVDPHADTADEMPAVNTGSDEREYTPEEVAKLKASLRKIGNSEQPTVTIPAKAFTTTYDPNKAVQLRVQDVWEESGRAFPVGIQKAYRPSPQEVTSINDPSLAESTSVDVPPLKPEKPGVLKRVLGGLRKLWSGK